MGNHFPCKLLCYISVELRLSILILPAALYSVADEESNRHLYVHIPGNLHIRNDDQGKNLTLISEPFPSRVSLGRGSVPLYLKNIHYVLVACHRVFCC